MGGKKEVKKTKEQIAKAAAARSRGKTNQKASLAVFLTPELHQRLIDEIPRQKVITVANVCDRLHVNGSVARAGIRELHEKGLIKPVHTHHRQLIYTTVAKKEEAEAED